MPRYVEGGGAGHDKGCASAAATAAASSGGGAANNWQHSDRVLVEEGVVFNVRYIGCLEIRASMKLLDFTTRSQVAK